MTKVPCTITAKSISILLDGQMRVIPRTQPNFLKIDKLLKKINGPKAVFETDKSRAKKVDKLRELLDIPVYVEKVTAGRVRVTDKGVLFNGAPIHNTIAKAIMRLMKEGYDVTPLANFMDKVMENDRGDIAEELYAWIESNEYFSIAPDGDFYAYKKVAADYASIHPGPNGQKLYNRIGTTISMPRELVDSDRHNTCSSGLHFCSFDYLKSYGFGGEEKVVIVKINPADVCAIPTDYNYAKGRAWRYEIVAEVPERDLSPEIFKPAVQVTDEDHRLIEHVVAIEELDWDDEDAIQVNGDTYDSVSDEEWDDSWQRVEDAYQRAETLHEDAREGKAKRTIPVIDGATGEVLRYIEE